MKEDAPKFFCGLDLGQTNDYSAFVALEQDRKEKELHYALRHLERYALGTSYTTVCERVLRLFEKPPLAGQTLCVDQTGVGRPVVDFFRKSLREYPVETIVCPACEGRGGHKTAGVTVENPWVVCKECQGKATQTITPARVSLRPITITAGTAITVEGAGWHVPKKELVSVLQIVLQTRRLHIARSLPEAQTLIRELEMFRVKITVNANETFECLTADTKVQTDRGEMFIQHVERDHYVLTRNGYNKVVWSGETKKVTTTCRVRFDNGSIIEGTPDHLIYTTNRGWVALEELTCRDLIQTRNPSYSMESNTENLPVVITTHGKIQTKHYTAPSGNFITDPSLLDTTSTTKTKTRTTTTSPTSNVSPNQNTPNDTAQSPKRKNANTAVSGFAVASRKCPHPNTRDSGSALSNAPCTVDLTENRCARTVAKGSSQTVTAGTGLKSTSVQTSAARPSVTRIGSTPQRHVCSATGSSGPKERLTNTARPVAPPVIVYHANPVPVYDLIVEGNHEFFANNILVHNSWRERDHDDLVLAVAIALWVAERGTRQLWVK